MTHDRSSDPRITLAVRGDADPVPGVREALQSLMELPEDPEDGGRLPLRGPITNRLRGTDTRQIG
ncbi:hypothetical protein [Candidatus Palauibacter sp.]|uniref:hypothetical protein n=1 Tax=Candidatus Palauibacter sp. TaxID=3101350 RepID=UPI003AF28F08